MFFKNLLAILCLASFGCASILEKGEENQGYFLIKELSQGDLYAPAYIKEGVPQNIPSGLKKMLVAKDWDSLTRQAYERLKQHPYDPPSLQLLALVAYQRKNFNRARYLSEISLKQDGKNPWLLNMAGLILLKEARLLQDYLKVMEKFDSAVQVDPEFVAARLNLGYLLLKMGDYSRAMEQFEQAGELCGGCSPAMTGMGMAFMRSGESRDEGKAILEKIFSKSPENIAAGYELALYYMSKGLKEKSRSILKRLSSGQDGKIRAGARKKISHLEKIL